VLGFDVGDSESGAFWTAFLRSLKARGLNSVQLVIVGVFANQAALLRLTGAVLSEIHDEWQVSDRRYLSEKSMTLLANPNPSEPEPAAVSPSST
jgi:transposase-like protein